MLSNRTESNAYYSYLNPSKVFTSIRCLVILPFNSEEINIWISKKPKDGISYLTGFIVLTVSGNKSKKPEKSVSFTDFKKKAVKKSNGFAKTGHLPTIGSSYRHSGTVYLPLAVLPTQISSQGWSIRGIDRIKANLSPPILTHENTLKRDYFKSV